MESQQIKGIIEALLFVSEKPLALDQIKNVLSDLESTAIRKFMEELIQDYQKRASGLRIVEVAGGFQMVTAAEYSSALKKFYRDKTKERLTGPSLETLAIIAYKQPVTRLDIEAIRGVNIDGVIKNLLDHGLIRIAGRKEVIGRPFVYGTTREFLEHFGLKSLEELPKIQEFSSSSLEYAPPQNPSEREDNNDPKPIAQKH